MRLGSSFPSVMYERDQGENGNQRLLTSYPNPQLLILRRNEDSHLNCSAWTIVNRKTTLQLAMLPVLYIGKHPLSSRGLSSQRLRGMGGEVPSNIWPSGMHGWECEDMADVFWKMLVLPSPSSAGQQNRSHSEARDTIWLATMPRVERSGFMTKTPSAGPFGKYHESKGHRPSFPLISLTSGTVRPIFPPHESSL
jgi:hypothetical protein